MAVNQLVGSCQMAVPFDDFLQIAEQISKPHLNETIPIRITRTYDGTRFEFLIKLQQFVSHLVVCGLGGFRIYSKENTIRSFLSSTFSAVFIYDNFETPNSFITVSYTIKLEFRNLNKTRVYHVCFVQVYEVESESVMQIRTR